MLVLVLVLAIGGFSLQLLVEESVQLECHPPSEILQAEAKDIETCLNTKIAAQKKKLVDEVRIVKCLMVQRLQVEAVKKKKKLEFLVNNNADQIDALQRKKEDMAETKKELESKKGQVLDTIRLLKEQLMKLKGKQ
mmetsp:Transcript_36187/g.71154  ORF Transcript_36187/g.71154 Transcript_36187/m.71154 type:complete len:136 (+) Transcript_36187:14-421(+)